jgi:hypothetical protein
MFAAQIVFGGAMGITVGVELYARVRLLQSTGEKEGGTVPGVLPEGGRGREAKEGDDGAHRRKVRTTLVQGRTRQRRTSEEGRGGGAHRRKESLAPSMVTQDKRTSLETSNSPGWGEEGGG